MSLCNRSPSRCPALCAVIAATVLMISHPPVIGAGRTDQIKDWNQYRGPDRNGISMDADWLAKWSGNGPKQLWKTSVGTGYASVSLRGDHLYTMGRDGDNDVVYCVNADTGDLIWTYAYKCKLIARNHKGGPAATPTIEGDRVWTYSKQGHLHCFDAENGKLVWSKDLRQAIGAKVPKWGFASSPLVVGDLLITDGGYAVAFNKNTGKLIWKSKEQYGAGYASPMAFDLNGTKCVVIFNAYGLVLFQVSDGKEMARHRWKTNYDVNAATPVVSGDHVFVSSNYDKGAAVVRFAGTTPTVVWQNKNMRNHFNSSVLWNGSIYGFDDKNLKCIDFKTGEERWSQRGLGKGSLMLADGKLIVLSERGELVIAQATPEKFDEISRASVLSGQCWTVPVLSGGRIYCRNSAGDLTCLDVSGG